MFSKYDWFLSFTGELENVRLELIVAELVALLVLTVFWQIFLYGIVGKMDVTRVST